MMSYKKSGKEATTSTLRNKRNMSKFSKQEIKEAVSAEYDAG